MSASLKIDYGDGSQKLFSFEGGNSLSELFQLAGTTNAGLKTNYSPDRGEIRILAFQIDGYGHSTPNAWSLTRNEKDFWPDVSEYKEGPVNDGDDFVFTLRQDS